MHARPSPAAAPSAISTGPSAFSARDAQGIVAAVRLGGICKSAGHSATRPALSASEPKMTDTQKAAAEPDYSATLFLPQTNFPMRAGLPDREPAWLKRWEDMGFYELQRRQQQGKPLFTLHDGPPYANGNIHIG